MPSGGGLTNPAGVVVTPDGSIWIADGEKGVCRVRTAPVALVESDWCGGEGPIDKAGQMAFDPDTNFLYVAEGDSESAGVWRLAWDPSSGTITSGRKILNTGEDLVTGIAVSYTGPPSLPGGPAGGEVNFITKDSSAVRRLRSPHAVLPTVVTVGFRNFDGELEEGGSIAALGADLYLSEPDGVTVINTRLGTTPVARPVAGGFPGGSASAVAVDAARARVYAGTSNGNARDQIDVLHVPTGRRETYTTGVAGVLSMAIAADGDLIIVDDPLQGVAADVNDMARVWRAELTAVGLPRVSITSEPPSYGPQRSARFEYAGPFGATFECSVDDARWAGCGGPDTGYLVLADLTEGPHVFEVRAIDPIFGPGPIERRVHVVDWTGPEVSIDNGDGDRYPAGTSFTLRFSAGEGNLEYVCSIDDAPGEACSPSTHYFDGLAPGWHTVRVKAVDTAGNWSAASASYELYVRPPAPPVAPPPPVQDAAAPSLPTPPATPVALGHARLSLARGYSCVSGGQLAWVKGRSIASVTYRLDGRPIKVLTWPDASGRFAVRLRRLQAGSHRLTATVRFASGAGAPERLRRDFKRCGADRP